MKYKKKILVISSRYPYPVRGGDKLRIAEIIRFLGKENSIDLMTVGGEKIKSKYINNQYIFKNNIFNKVYQIFLSIFKNEPLQVGLYNIPKMKDEIKKKCNNYDVIIFHLIRTASYLPAEFKGKKILEMTDLISKNYQTTLESLSFLNPLYLIYKIEKKLLIKYEEKIFNKFDKIVLVNDKDIYKSKVKAKFRKKIEIIGNGSHIKKNIYIKNKSKKSIIFFGNINSLANRTACYDFVNNVIPNLKKIDPEIKFKILGNCSFLLKIYFSLKKVKCYPNIKKLSDYSKDALAGICNVKIQSGLQNKILDYTSHGIPAIINPESNNFKFFSNKDVLIYKNDNSLLKYLSKLKEDLKFRSNISKNCHRKTKKYYNWNKILKKYKSII